MDPKIAYQGEPGSNSSVACQEMYPDLQPLACSSFEEAFSLVAGGSAELAMIPIENSSAGRVADIHRLLPASNLQIIGEYFLGIRFDLLGIPGSKIEDAKEAHSHIHALGQCRGIIQSLNLTPVIAGDTAGSAREVRAWNDPTKVSLAPPKAAEMYGLDVLASGVEDDPTNTTRFVILSRERPLPKRSELPDHVVTTLVFRVRNVASALFKALGGFATCGVNMTRIESYMVGVEFAATKFLVDLQGHPEDRPMKKGLEELAFFTSEVKILGVYAAHSHRSNQNVPRIQTHESSTFPA